MIRLNSALFALAAQFTNRFAPFQGVHITTHPQGGAVVAASDRGAATLLALDPTASLDEEDSFIPSDELVKACRGIKTAQREIQIAGNSAVVTTFRKSSSEAKEFPIHRTQQRLPGLPGAIAAAVDYWSATPELSATAGRYDTQLLSKAIRAMADETDSVVISAFQGGPLRLQREDTSVVVMLMPQTAQPIPPLPDWLVKYATEAAACQG